MPRGYLKNVLPDRRNGHKNTKLSRGGSSAKTNKFTKAKDKETREDTAPTVSAQYHRLHRKPSHQTERDREINLRSGMVQETWAPQKHQTTRQSCRQEKRTPTALQQEFGKKYLHVKQVSGLDLTDVAQTEANTNPTVVRVPSSITVSHNKMTVGTAVMKRCNPERSLVKSTPTKLGDCAICLETKPLIQLLNKCNHELACFECLRTTYVTDAQKNLFSYPMRCFDPECNRAVCSPQLKNHRLLKYEEEFVRHDRFDILGRARTRRGDKLLAHCPECDHPAYFKSQSTDIRWSNCRECDFLFGVRSCPKPKPKPIVESPKKVPFKSKRLGPTDEASTLAVVAAFEPDARMGCNFGYARCPGCRMIISKGDGCSSMRCPCGTNFSWNEVGVYKPKVPLSRQQPVAYGHTPVPAVVVHPGPIVDSIAN